MDYRFYLTVMVLAVMTGTFAYAQTPQPIAKAISPDDIWVDEYGVPSTLPIIQFLNDVLRGGLISGSTKEILAKTFKDKTVLTESDLPKIKETFSKPEIGKPFFLNSIPLQPSKSTTEESGSLTGTTYKIKQLDGSEFVDRSGDFILIFPFTREFFTGLTTNDSKAAREQLMAEVKAELKKCAEAGDKGCESGLKVLEVGGTPAKGSVGAAKYNEIMNKYTAEGKFNTYNLRELVARFTASEAGAKALKVQPDDFGKFSVEKIAAGFWMVYYSQKVMDYLTLAEIKPNQTTTVELFHPFDYKPFLNLGR